MNYYRELNEGLNKYIRNELGEDKETLTESTFNEANPLKALGNLVRGVKEEGTYTFDGQTFKDKKKFDAQLILNDIELTSQQQKALEVGNVVEVNGHKLQMTTAKTTRNDRRNDKKSQANVDKDGNVSTEGKLSIQPIKVGEETQFALFLGKSNRLTIYPTAKALGQAIQGLSAEYRQLVQRLKVDSGSNNANS